MGNMLSKPGWTYIWDNENRLVKAVGDSKTVEFTYDPLGRRSSKKVNGAVAIEYHYDGQSTRLLYETEGETIKNWYNWVGDRLVNMRTASGTVYYFEYNAHGDVIGLRIAIARK